MFFAGCILAIPMAAWSGHLGAALVLIGIVLVEVLVLALNRGSCPLTAIAARHTTDREANFDIFLPVWLARNNKLVFGSLFIAGVIYTLALATHSMGIGAQIGLLLAQGVVAATGLFFLALGVGAWLVPERVGRFLLAFAQTPGVHYAELAIRLLVGGAFIHAANASAYPPAFYFFGLLLVGTTVPMLLIPWRWHRRFAERAVPPALRLLPLMGLVSIAAGGLALWAVLA